MATQWRSLFDGIGVEWIDRGRNCSRGHININCPYCYDDPSYHCTISETLNGFYCYRNPSHKGHAVFLLEKLLGSRTKAQITLDDYTDSRPAEALAPLPRIDYDRFLPAHDSVTMLRYLVQRGFDYPSSVVRRFDLRYAIDGKWAQRLLIPLIDIDGKVQSFVGRAVRDNLEPRYKVANPDVAADLVSGCLTGETWFIVEGPIDALKFNAAMYQQLNKVSAIALLGLALPPGRLRILLKHQPKHINLWLDQRVSYEIENSIAKQLRQFSKTPISIIKMEQKDLGEMSEIEIREFVKGETHAVELGRSV